MPQTDFLVADAAELTAALATISTDAAPNIAYTVTLTSAPIALDSGTLNLATGSSVDFTGAYRLIITEFSVVGAVTTDLNFAGTITLDGGSVDNVALTKNGGGTVVAGYFMGQIAGTGGAVNDGTIAFSGMTSAVDFADGSVLNGWDGTNAALISGTEYGVQIADAGTVQNAGTITASDPVAGIGVSLGAGTVDNGTVAYQSALISGGNDGVQIIGVGLVANDGTIAGSGTAGITLGSGTVDNGEAGDTGALLDGNPGIGIAIGAGGIAADNGAGSVGNFGTITTTGSVGVELGAGGTVTNGSASDASAMITAAFEGVLVGQPGSAFAGTVENYATITANGDDTIQDVLGVFLDDGGSVQNLGTASLISAVDFGAVVEGAVGSVLNAGSIIASGANGIGVDLAGGGTVDNGLAPGDAATIQGGYDGVLIEGGAPGAGALVDNQGTIVGSIDFESGFVVAAGTVINGGLIESSAGASGYSVYFGDGNERLVLQAGGRFIGGVLGYEAAPDSTTTLEFAGGTSGSFTWAADDSGTVTDGAGSFSFGAFGTITLDGGASWTLQTAASATQTIQFQAGGPPAVLALATPATTPAAVQATITGFGPGGTIDLLNIANSLVTSFNYAGSTLDVLGNGGTLAVLELHGPYSSNSFAHTADTATTGTFITTNVMPCFAAGTAIRTRRGEVRVQDMRIGDAVLCAGGHARPVVWIGRRRVDVARHPAPDTVAPIRVRRDAFADGVPCRDLWLSPDHAVFVDGLLIAIRQLVNGSTIARIAPDAVTYFHVELDRHDVLFAENLAAESYLDTGNRYAFEDTGGVVSLHPDFARDRQVHGCAPLAVEADRVEPTWRRLAARAAASGLPACLPGATADADLRLVAAGRNLRPSQIDAARCLFVLPPRAGALRIASRSGAPSALRPWHDDRRRLGVQVGRIVLHDRTGRTEMPVDHPALAEGWHAVEHANGRHWRWTDGDAELAVPAATTMLEIHLAGRTDYPVTGVAAPAQTPLRHGSAS